MCVQTEEEREKCVYVCVWLTCGWESQPPPLSHWQSSAGLVALLTGLFSLHTVSLSLTAWASFAGASLAHSSVFRWGPLSFSHDTQRWLKMTFNNKCESSPRNVCVITACIYHVIQTSCLVCTWVVGPGFSFKAWRMFMFKILSCWDKIKGLRTSYSWFSLFFLSWGKVKECIF